MELMLQVWKIITTFQGVVVEFVDLFIEELSSLVTLPVPIIRT